MGVGMGPLNWGRWARPYWDGVGDVSDLLDMFLPYTVTVYCVTTPNSVIQ